MAYAPTGGRRYCQSMCETKDASSWSHWDVGQNFQVFMELQSPTECIPRRQAIADVCDLASWNG